MIEALKRAVKLRLVKRLTRENDAELRTHSKYANGRLSESYWNCDVNSAGHLSIDGCDLEEVARSHGTPLHVIHVKRLRENYHTFLDAFSECRGNVQLATSYKTNPLPFVLSELHRCGTLAEVISHFELWLALRLGVPGNRIIFNGPGKTEAGLACAVDHAVHTINIDSLDEIAALDHICHARRRRQRIGVRVTTNVGWQSQFGLNIDSGLAMQAFETIARSTSLDAVGIHLHLGTGIKNVATYAEGVGKVLKFALDVYRRFDIAIHTLDLGGGFGVPTVRGITEWDLRAQSLGFPLRSAVPELEPSLATFANVISPLINRYVDELAGHRVDVIFEPGRAITGSAQTLLLSVIRVKRRTPHQIDVIVDGGKNITMPLGWEFHEILPVGKMLEQSLTVQSIFGPLCHPGDVVALHKSLPRLDPGDVIAVMDAGAYFIPNQMCFSNPRPGAVYIINGRAEWARSPETFEDIVARDDIRSE